ncbi:MAG: tail fiber domain-containing protein [Candidatus Babeliales bacterium]
MKKCTLLLLIVTYSMSASDDLTKDMPADIAQEIVDADAQRRIFNTVLIRESLQVGSFIVSGNGLINALTVTGNANIGGSLDVHGTITINGSPISASGGGGSGGSGNVVGPTSPTTANAVVLFTDTTGKAIEQSANNPVTSAPVVIDSSTNMSNVNNLTITANINLPITATDFSQGIVTLDSQPFIHAENSNTALGIDALQNTKNNSGASNVAVGHNALQALTTGEFNIAVGENTLENNVSGNNNVAIGQGALFSSSNSDNVGIGFIALSGTKGSQNVAIGSNALSNLGNHTSISNNIALGFNAGINLNNTGTNVNNIYIGSVGPASLGAENNTTRIGSQSAGTGACFIGGISGITTTVADAIPVLVSQSTGQLGTASSSFRYKKDITTMESVAVALMKLRPVRFRYKIHDETTPAEYGLIAEEVARVAPDLVIYKDGQPETVKYHALPILLLKAVQELATKNNEQQVIIEQLIQRIAALEKQTH